MNIEHIYRSHIDYSKEYKMDNKVKRIKWILIFFPLWFILSIAYISYVAYLEISKNIDVTYYNLVGFFITIIFLAILTYNFNYSNPTKNLNEELQLFVWQVYFLKKMENFSQLPRNKFSIKYADYLSKRMQITYRFRKLTSHLENSFIFYSDNLFEIELCKNLKRAIHNVDITIIDTEQFENLLELIRLTNQIYAYVYSEKIAGLSEETTSIVNSLVNKKTSLKIELKN